MAQSPLLVHTLIDSILQCTVGPQQPQREKYRLHSEIWGLENIVLLLFVVFSCNYFIWERPSRVPAFVLWGEAPAPQSLEAAEKPCMRHCDHFSSFIFAEAMYLWLNLAQHFRSHWYTSKKWALLDQNRLKFWTWTSTDWTLRTVHSRRQLLLDKNQGRTKCIFSISAFINSMANAFIPSEEKS